MVRRLWCRLRGHRWEPHHHTHAGVAAVSVVQWCPRCGFAKLTPDADAAAAWRERRFDEL